MDCALTPSQRRSYVAWLHSPSVFSSDPSETILAFKIAAATGCVASRVLRALRGESGLDPALVARVEAFVAADASLDFVIDEDGIRRITLVG
jgi:hypothetical protein